MLIFIPGHVPSSKNSRRNTKTGRSFPSKATVLWRQVSRYYWGKYRKDFVQMSFGHESPLIVGLHFVRKTKHIWDFVNPVQTIQDEMVHQGWIPEDTVSQIFPVPLNVEGSYWSIDKNNPGVYIKILSSFAEADINYPKLLINSHETIRA